MRTYITFDEPIIVTCPRCCGGRGSFINPCDWCGATGGVPPEAADDRLATLAHNLAIAAFGATMFRAGDNFGFHMGADETQCTCQWSPGHGEPYRGFTRCEQDEIYDDDRENDAP